MMMRATTSALRRAAHSQQHQQQRLASTITAVHAREVIDSRGNPTVECEVTTEKGTFSGISPSGASTGAGESLELRDGGSRFHGKGVLKAVGNVNKVLGPKLISSKTDVADQRAVDDLLLKLDGTETKSNMGANAILAVSLACAKAGAAARGVPLFEHFAHLGDKPTDSMVMPVPCLNVINGGSHAGNLLPFQEFMLMPTEFSTFKDSLRAGCEVYQTLKGVIKKQYGLDATNVGDEGGFAPNVSSATESLDLLMEAIKQAGYEGKVQIALDVAASEMHKKSHQGSYDLNFKGTPGKIVSGAELRAEYSSLIAKYPIVSIEDPFDEEDWDAYAPFTAAVGNKVQIVGDDLLVTNPKFIAKGIEKKAVNALLLKVNQIGSVSESIDATLMAQKAGWGVMTSHRSGETEDTTIADLAVGLHTGQIKTGAPARSERLAKYNQLLRIEEALGSRAVFAGKNFRKP